MLLDAGDEEMIKTGEVVMSHRQGTCAKCGAAGDWIGYKYLPRGHPEPNHAGARQDEHLDFVCGRCGFEWEGDCLDAKVPGKLFISDPDAPDVLPVTIGGGPER